MAGPAVRPAQRCGPAVLWRQEGRAMPWPLGLQGSVCNATPLLGPRQGSHSPPSDPCGAGPGRDSAGPWEPLGAAAMCFLPKQSPLLQAQVPRGQDAAVLVQHQGLSARGGPVRARAGRLGRACRGAASAGAPRGRRPPHELAPLRGQRGRPPGAWPAGRRSADPAGRGLPGKGPGVSGALPCRRRPGRGPPRPR